MARIVITDLTRFKNPELVCTAGIDLESNRCIRPNPYFKKEFCEKYSIASGTVLEGQFHAKGQSQPHIEDHTHRNVMPIGSASVSQFKSALSNSCFESLSEGFGVELEERSKVIPYDPQAIPVRSLITVNVKNPRSIRIERNKFKEGSFQLSFCDGTDVWHNYLPITDLGFLNAVTTDPQLIDVSEEIRSASDSVFLRVGIGRYWENENGKSGYWLQVNGIYPFPSEKLKRGYGKASTVSSAPKSASIRTQGEQPPISAPQPVAVPKVKDVDRENRVTKWVKSIFDNPDHEYSEELFIQLKKLRNEIKTRDKVPWDVVFVDDILKEMATIRPVNENEFLQLEGVDDLKLEKYGQVFIQKIRIFCGLES